MEVVYAVDMKMFNDGEEFEQTLAMDVSCLNILACSCFYLFPSSKVKYGPHLASTPLQQAAKSSFCVYLCSLEQPWHYGLIASSQVPIVNLVWSLDGTHLLVCNQTGVCRIFKMKNGCINTMENIYQYETNEDILTAKYMFYKEPIIVDLSRKDSLFYGKDNSQSPLLQYALNSGNFVCVTTSGTIHTLPLNRSLSPLSYSLAKHDPLCASLCDVFATEQGFNVVLGERTQGALVHLFVVHYQPLEPKLAYISCRRRGFRIPSCYGTLKSLIYFQRNGNDCVLTYMTSFSGDLLDLYEYNLEQEQWISIALLNSPQARITSIALSPSPLLVKDNDFQGQFGRQILVALSDGSMITFDKLNLKCKEQSFPMSSVGLYMQHNRNKSEFFVRIQHTHSGACCVGFTQSGTVVLLRTISLDHTSTPSMLAVLVHLFEQHIVQTPVPFDIWDVLCLVRSETDNSTINALVEQLITHYDSQTLEVKRSCFPRFKECLYHIHRLASPYTSDSCEHLTALLVYHVLLIIREYLRLFTYEGTNRDFVDVAQEILQQPTFPANIDPKKIKYIGDQPGSISSTTIDPRQYQLISFTSLINWVSDIIFYLIGYLQLQQVPSWLGCKNFFNDPRQLQWLREFIIYFYVLNKMNKISFSKIANLQSSLQPAQPPPQTSSQDPQQQASTSPAQKDVLRDIYNSLSKMSQKIEVQKTNVLDESLLEEFSVLDIETLQAKADGMFPRPYPFLIQNSHNPQAFIRGQAPPFVGSMCGTPVTVETLADGSLPISSVVSSCNNSLVLDDNNRDTKFDVITLGKMSLSSSPTFRRCLRCSNFSRIFKSKPYPFLVYRLDNRCLCGGLFLLYTRSPQSGNINSNSDMSTASTAR